MIVAFPPQLEGTLIRPFGQGVRTYELDRSDDLIEIDCIALTQERSDLRRSPFLAQFGKETMGHREAKSLL